MVGVDVKEFGILEDDVLEGKDVVAGATIVGTLEEAKVLGVGGRENKRGEKKTRFWDSLENVERKRENEIGNRKDGRS